MAARYCAAPPAVALTAATAKTVLNIIPGASVPVTLVELSVSVDSAGHALVELCESTQAGAGTPGTQPTVKQTGGFVAGDTTAPAATTVQAAYTAEPTVLVRLKAYRFVTPGSFTIQFPLGREPQSLVSGSSKYKGLALRVTASVSGNADAHMEWEE